MPKYIGPYDVIQPDGDGGKVYHVGDNVTVSGERLAQLRNIEHYRFEDDPPEAVSPVHATIVADTQIMPPNDMGVAEVAVEEDKDKAKKSS